MPIARIEDSLVRAQGMRTRFTAMRSSRRDVVQTGRPFVRFCEYTAVRRPQRAVSHRSRLNRTTAGPTKEALLHRAGAWPSTHPSSREKTDRGDVALPPSAGRRQRQRPVGRGLRLQRPQRLPTARGPCLRRPQLPREGPWDSLPATATASHGSWDPLAVTAITSHGGRVSIVRTLLFF